jgi:Spy/CpxP family protein refolding chaperone
MNPKFFIIAAVLSMGLVAIASEPTTEQQITPDQIVMTAVMKGAFRQFWDGRGLNPITIEEALRDENVRRDAWGISDEQWKQIDDYVSKIAEKTLRSVEREMMEMTEALPENWEADGEIVKKIQDFAEQAEKSGALIMDAVVDALDNTLTPAQKQKIMESQLANAGEMPIISPGMFEILNLTDAQKKEMEKIKKELEPEFEKVLDDFLKRAPSLMGHIEKPIEDPELKKIRDEIQSQGKKFSEKFRIRMFDVLTDEQWNRMLNLIDNPPEHAKIFRKKLKEISGEREEDEKTEKPPVWQPGPNSWKPGDAIPEQYRQERNERQGSFPTRESE